MFFSPGNTRASTVTSRRTRRVPDSVSRNKYVHSPRRRINPRFIGLICFFSIFVILYYFIFISTFFNIREISISGASGDELIGLSNTFNEHVKDVKIFYVDKESLSDLVVGTFPDYKLVSTEKIWPGMLNVVLEKRNAAYIIQAPNGTFILDDEYFVMDTVGAYLGYEIQVKYDQNLELGQNISDRNLIASFAYVSGKTIINVSGGEISVDLAEGGKVLLPKDKSISNYEEVSKILQKIMQKYTIENKDIDTIDLRFSKPLIKYAE